MGQSTHPPLGRSYRVDEFGLSKLIPSVLHFAYIFHASHSSTQTFPHYSKRRFGRSASLSVFLSRLRLALDCPMFSFLFLMTSGSSATYAAFHSCASCDIHDIYRRPSSSSYDHIRLTPLFQSSLPFPFIRVPLFSFPSPGSCRSAYLSLSSRFFTDLGTSHHTGNI